MTEHIVERAIILANSPAGKILSKERFCLYVPIARYGQPGVATYNSAQFEVIDGVVSLQNIYLLKEDAANIYISKTAADVRYLAKVEAYDDGINTPSALVTVNEVGHTSTINYSELPKPYAIVQYDENGHILIKREDDPSRPQYHRAASVYDVAVIGYDQVLTWAEQVLPGILGNYVLGEDISERLKSYVYKADKPNILYGRDASTEKTYSIRTAVPDITDYVGFKLRGGIPGYNERGSFPLLVEVTQEFGELLPTYVDVEPEEYDAINRRWAESNFAKKSDISKVYKPCGSVVTYADLPADVQIGDVYSVDAAYGDYPPDTNFVWLGDRWDALGGHIDLSGYLKKSEANAQYLRKPTTSSYPVIPIIDASGTQSTVQVHTDSVGNAVVKRDGSGNILLPNVIPGSRNAVPKQYVDEAIDAKIIDTNEALDKIIEIQEELLSGNIPEQKVYRHSLYLKAGEYEYGGVIWCSETEQRLCSIFLPTDKSLDISDFISCAISVDGLWEGYDICDLLYYGGGVLTSIYHTEIQIYGYFYENQVGKDTFELWIPLSQIEYRKELVNFDD